MEHVLKILEDEVMISKSESEPEESEDAGMMESMSKLDSMAMEGE